MSRFNPQDMKLLSEAYTLRLLKEQAPSMTLEQVKQKLPHMTESEAEYVITVCGRITEAFGGLGSMGRAIGGAARGLGKGLAGVGRGAIEAGKEFGGNVKDIYQSGEDAKRQSEIVNKAQSAIDELVDLVNQAVDETLISVKGGDPMGMTLNDIINDLQGAATDREGHKQDALKKGLGGGLSSAFGRGFNAKPKPKAAPVSAGPPPLPTP